MADDNYGGAGYAPFGDPGKDSFDKNDSVPPNAFSDASPNPGERNTGVDSRYLGREDRIDALYYKNQNNGNIPEQQVIKSGPKVNYYANGSQSSSYSDNSYTYKASYSRVDKKGVRRYYAKDEQGQEVEAKPSNYLDELSDKDLKRLVDYFLTKNPDFKLPEYDPEENWAKKRVDDNVMIKDEKEQDEGKTFREEIEKQVLEQAIKDTSSKEGQDEKKGNIEALNDSMKKIDDHNKAISIAEAVKSYKDASGKDKEKAEKELKNNAAEIMKKALFASKSMNK